VEPVRAGLVAAGPAGPLDEVARRRPAAGEQAAHLWHGEPDHPGVDGRWLAGPDRWRCLAAGPGLSRAAATAQIARAAMTRTAGLAIAW
jgi:hypothetical protein